MMNVSKAKKSSWHLQCATFAPWLPFLFSAVVFTALWLTDHPKPMWDDLFFYGASHHLAQGGECINPLLVRQEFLSRYFFAYPPISVDLLAGWLVVFGISATSVTAFCATAYFALSSLSIVLLRKLGAGLGFQCLVPIAAAAAFLEVGLRPEVSATVFFMAGMAITTGVSPTRQRFFWGSFFIVFGIATAPRWVSFGAVFAAFLCWEWWRNTRQPSAALVSSLLSAGLGAALAGFVFLFAIEFRVIEFWQTFHVHARERTSAQSKLWVLDHFVFVRAGPSRWPLVLLAGWWLCRRFPPATTVDRLAWCLAGAFPLAVMGGSLGHGATWFLALILLLLASQGATRSSSSARIWPWLTTAVVLVLANVRPIVEIVGGMTGAIVAEESANYPDAIALEPTPEHPLLIDSSSARYLYDYRLPDGCLDFEFAARFPGVDATMAPLRPSDVYIVGSLGMTRLAEQRWCPPQVRTVRPLGAFAGTIPAEPRRIFIVTGEECRERLRAQGKQGREIHLPGVGGR
jgi:hypothetical protein